MGPHKVLMFTGDVVGTQLPQGAVLPPRIFGALGVPIRCHPMQNMLLNFIKDDNLQANESITGDADESTYDTIWTRSATYLQGNNWDPSAPLPGQLWGQLATIVA
jgi:hypothetical protein